MYVCGFVYFYIQDDIFSAVQLDFVLRDINLKNEFKDIYEHKINFNVKLKYVDRGLYVVNFKRFAGHFKMCMHLFILK